MAYDLTALRAAARRKISFQSIAQAKYPTTDLDANINMWYRIVLGWVFEACGIWEFNGEVSTANFVQDQIEYVLPTALVSLVRVELKYPNQTDYVPATRVDDKEVSGSAFGNGEIDIATEGSPRYRLLDNSLFIYPAPSAAVTSGIRIETIVDVSDLSAGGDSPNLNPVIQHVLAIGAAYEYCLTQEMARKAQMFYNQIFGRSGKDDDPESLKHQVQTLAAKRDQSVKQRLIPRMRSFR